MATWTEGDVPVAGRVVHIPGVGHNPRREAYAPYRDAVTAFLAEIHHADNG